MTVPARLSFVTIGARDVAALREFYGQLWPETASAPDGSFAAYHLGGAVLGLYDLDRLAGDSGGEFDGRGGFELAINVDRREQVDEVLAEVAALGAFTVAADDAFWGGRVGHFRDPEGNRWEVAWNPAVSFDDRGAVTAFGERLDSPAMAAPGIGETAPDFTLKSTNGEEITLSQFRGQKPVVLVFHPFSFTGICEAELCSLRDDYTPFEASGAQILVVSTDPSPSQKMWADEQGWTFPVLSDFWPHGEVAKAYGAFNEERGCANRVTAVIDTDGKLVDWFDTPGLTTARTTERYAEAMAKL